jgi:hypothetical protein
MSASAEFLRSGQSLSVGQHLESHDGRYVAIMQGDGNFVVYRNADGVAIWNSGTGGTGATFAVMQGDGNFVIYTADGRAVWSTGTSWQAGSLPNEFTIDDYGLAVVVSYIPVWVTNTVTPGAPPGDSLVFQFGYKWPPGVVYNGPNGNQWTFQTDGNLVLYHNGAPVWASNVTNNKSGKAIYSVWEGILTTWNDSGVVWNGASNRNYPPGFIWDGPNASLHLGGDGGLFAIQADGNATAWVAARKWGASTYDPPAAPPPPSGPHCIGDPHACAESGGTYPVINYPW